jgi:hypothetical protein
MSLAEMPKRVYFNLESNITQTQYIDLALFNDIYILSETIMDTAQIFATRDDNKAQNGMLVYEWGDATLKIYGKEKIDNLTAEQIAKVKDLCAYKLLNDLVMFIMNKDSQEEEINDCDMERYVDEAIEQVKKGKEKT